MPPNTSSGSPEQTYRITPTLKACLLWSAIRFCWVFLAILIVSAVTGKVRVGTSPESWSRLSGVLIVMILASFVLGLLLFVIGWIWSAEISQRGIRASTFFGRKVLVPWSSISGIERTSIQGFPALRLQSESPRVQLYVYTLGIDLNETLERLGVTAGPQHALTMWFSEGAI